MTQFIILIVFTILVSPLLYFFPSNIPLKTKFSILFLALMLSIGGLFLLDILSYWVSVTVMIGVALIASYFAEKRLIAKKERAEERTEILLSFKKDHRLDAKNEFTTTEQQNIEGQKESAVTVEDKEHASNVKITEPEHETINLEEKALKKDFHNEQDELITKLTQPTVVNNQSEGLNDLLDIDITEEEFDFLNKGREGVLEDISSEYVDPFNNSSKMMEDNQENPDWFVDLEELEEIDEFEEKNVQKIESDSDIYRNNSSMQEVQNESSVNRNMDFELKDMLLTTLEFYKEQRDNTSYYATLDSVLSQNLSDSDYYLFSKLLVEFYMINNYYFKATELLLDMKGRLEKFPLVTEEIQYYLLSFNDSTQNKI
ncbi:DUF4118 domain-containing protein [Fictibacillus halophilus]|uniref:DUF4118 domain-containing protein n=1 Tax=Fictibacillus halophilus TaxID=1610490 RepID=UPI001CFAEDCF|nr:DUF4118 domain-containing protein [Fictibacillus halophilus]